MTIKNASRKSGKRVAPSVSYESWLTERLKDPAEAAAYLEAVIEEGDQAAIMLAMRQIAQAKKGGIAAVARKAHRTREATYRMLSKDGNPGLDSFMSLLKATDMQLSVKPIPVKKAA